jgi:hypothetical protein
MVPVARREAGHDHGVGGGVREDDQSLLIDGAVARGLGSEAELVRVRGARRAVEIPGAIGTIGLVGILLVPDTRNVNLRTSIYGDAAAGRG